MSASIKDPAHESRRRELVEILLSAGPLMLEGYSPLPAVDPRRRELLSVESKGSFRDLVTVFDKKVEAHIRERLLRSFAGENIIGEEDCAEKKISPREAAKGLSSFWLIDPIDGTTNYSRAYPFFCTTAAFVEWNAETNSHEVLVGGVYNPVSGEMFSASRGGGAWLNRESMRVTTVAQPETALLTTGFASTRASNGNRAYELFGRLTKMTLGVRRDGSAALDLAFVAAGRIDAYWEWGLAPWDTAAGILLVNEAQGRTTALDNQPLDFLSGEILASNGFLHKWLVDRIKESQDEPA